MRERNLAMDGAGPPSGRHPLWERETCNSARSSLRSRLPAVGPPGLESGLQSTARNRKSVLRHALWNVAVFTEINFDSLYSPLCNMADDEEVLMAFRTFGVAFPTAGYDVFVFERIEIA